MEKCFNFIKVFILNVGTFFTSRSPSKMFTNGTAKTMRASYSFSLMYAYRCTITGNTFGLLSTMQTIITTATLFTSRSSYIMQAAHFLSIPNARSPHCVYVFRSNYARSLSNPFNAKDAILGFHYSIVRRTESHGRSRVEQTKISPRFWCSAHWQAGAIRASLVRMCESYRPIIY